MEHQVNVLEAILVRNAEDIERFLFGFFFCPASENLSQVLVIEVM
jgi:hypothetical protein